jgi:hypothetical protein
MTKTALISGNEIKAIDFEPWGGLDGFLEATQNGKDTGKSTLLRGLVPWLQRGVSMTGNAVSTIPFSVIDDSGNVVDSSANWKNSRGGIANPSRLIYLVAASLCSGAAYLRIASTSRAISEIRYQVPTSITPKFNDATGELIGFERTVKGNSSPVPVKEMLYFWLPDDTVENGPAVISPVSNAVLAADLISQMDVTLKQYGKNNFVPPMILAAKGMPTREEAEKAENKYNLFLRMKLGIAKIFNAETMTAQPVGAGMQEMRGSYLQITRQQIENIAAAFGIPAGVFMSGAANYATALADRRVWYESGVFVLLYQTIQEVLTDQLFSRFGLRFQFNIDGLDAFQEDEVAKAGSFQAYVTAGLPKSLAAELVGLDLPSGWEYDDLDEETETEPTPADTLPESDPLVSQDEEALAAEMMKCQRYAVKSFGNPKAAPVDFRVIPPVLATRISAKLRTAKSADEIHGIFAEASADIPAIVLAMAINRAVENG